MLQDLDKTLKTLLELHLPDVVKPTGTYAISFETPDQQHMTAASINLFLYDVRENLDLRSTVSSFERQSNGSAIRRRSPARIDCSYLVSVWPTSQINAEEEHRILGGVMQVLLRYPTLPAEILQGSLSGQDSPVRTFSLRPGQLHNTGDFWQAMGGKPKATLNYTVTISVPNDEVLETAPPVLSQPAMAEPFRPVTPGQGG